jgi:hypothetical protein
MRQGTWKISTSAREENGVPMGSSSKSKAARPKSSLKPLSAPTQSEPVANALENAPIQITPEELLNELQSDPAMRVHIEKAVATVALRKQTEMFQAVQKELAEAREELAQRR